MKRILFTLTLIMFVGMQHLTAFAATNSKVDNLLPVPGYETESGGQELPTGNLETEILPRLIKILLQLVGAASFCIFVYAGIMLIISQGNEEQMTKFKGVLIWSAVGLAFISTAYAIVSGILKLNFT